MVLCWSCVRCTKIFCVSRCKIKTKRLSLTLPNWSAVQRVLPSSHTDINAAFTSATVSWGSHSSVTVSPSRLARNRSVILSGSSLYNGRDRFVDDTIALSDVSDSQIHTSTFFIHRFRRRVTIPASFSSPDVSDSEIRSFPFSSIVESRAVSSVMQLELVQYWLRRQECCSSSVFRNSAAIVVQCHGAFVRSVIR
jgi:hypothetical protein